jgi:hypothetical protein
MLNENTLQERNVGIDMVLVFCFQGALEMQQEEQLQT